MTKGKPSKIGKSSAPQDSYADYARQIAVAESILRRYRNAFCELAK